MSAFGKRAKSGLEKFVMKKGREAGNLAQSVVKREPNTDKRTGVRLPLPVGRGHK